MIHEKTFNAISKLKEIEIELHRLKNALELANKALDAKRKWVGLTDEEIEEIWGEDLRVMYSGNIEATKSIEAKLKEKNSGLTKTTSSHASRVNKLWAGASNTSNTSRH